MLISQACGDPSLQPHLQQLLDDLEDILDNDNTSLYDFLRNAPDPFRDEELNLALQSVPTPFNAIIYDEVMKVFESQKEQLWKHMPESRLPSLLKKILSTSKQITLDKVDQEFVDTIREFTALHMDAFTLCKTLAAEDFVVFYGGKYHSTFYKDFLVTYIDYKLAHAYVSTEQKCLEIPPAIPFTWDFILLRNRYN